MDRRDWPDDSVSDKPREVEWAIASLVELDRVRRLVEVGCGDGRLAIRLAGSIAAGGTVLALDRDREAIGRARRLVRQAGTANVELSWGDAYELPVEDGAVDAVVCSSLLCSVARPDRVVGEMCRVVRPGGVVVAGEPGGPQLVHEPDDERFAQLSAKLNSAFRIGWLKKGADQEIGLRVAEIFLRHGLRQLAAEGVCQVHLLSDRRRHAQDVLEQLRVEAASLSPPTLAMLRQGGISKRELEEHRQRAGMRLSRHVSDPACIEKSGYIRVMPPLIVTAGRKPVG